MNYLEAIEARICEIEEQIREKIDDPCAGPQRGHISGSCDFVRQLLREAEAAGERVEHRPDSPVYFLNGMPIQAEGNPAEKHLRDRAFTRKGKQTTIKKKAIEPSLRHKAG